MRKISLLMICLLVFGFSFINAQVISSKKSTIHINNKPKIEKDITPPTITLVSPDIKRVAKPLVKESVLNLIGRVSDKSGINSLFINEEKTEVPNDGVFMAKIPLNPGDNEISIIAMDSLDNIAETKFMVEYIPKILSLAEKVERESNYYGLIIGVNKYEDPRLTSLDNPIKDAEKLYNTLTDNYTFEKENIKLIKDARRDDIINALDDLARKVTPNDNLLIFYAGHGWWDKEANIGYWLPTDARSTGKSAWFRNSALCDYLREIKSKHTLVISDACFSGSIFKARSAFHDASKAINKLYELPSRKAMTSGTLTEVPDRSAFIRFLIDRLSINTEKYLSSEQLFSSFRMAVINNSDVLPQYGDIQNVGDEGGDFIFIKK